MFANEKHILNVPIWLILLDFFVFNDGIRGLFEAIRQQSCRRMRDQCKMSPQEETYMWKLTVSWTLNKADNLKGEMKRKRSGRKTTRWREKPLRILVEMCLQVKTRYVPAGCCCRKMREIIWCLLILSVEGRFFFPWFFLLCRLTMYWWLG